MRPTQVPRTNRGHRESLSLALRTRDPSQKHRQHRSLHWRKPCCEPSGYPSCEGCCSAGAILSVSPWYDLEANNQTMDNNAETDGLFTKALLGLFQDLKARISRA